MKAELEFRSLVVPALLVLAGCLSTLGEDAEPCSPPEDSLAGGPTAATSTNWKIDAETAFYSASNEQRVREGRELHRWSDGTFEAPSISMGDADRIWLNVTPLHSSPYAVRAGALAAEGLTITGGSALFEGCVPRNGIGMEFTIRVDGTGEIKLPFHVTIEGQEPAVSRSNFVPYYAKAR